MATPRFLTSLPKHTGTTRSEAITVLSIALVIAAGTIGPWIFADSPLHEVATAHKIIAMLDSMAAVQSTAPDSSEREYEQHVPRARTTASASVPQRKIININTASMAQLERLPGVGPATAEAIIKRRTMRKFMHVDDLMDIRGIGLKKLEKIRPYIEARSMSEEKQR